MDHWNDINLAMPSLSNYCISKKKIDIDKFKKLLGDAINYFSHMSDLDLEIEQITSFIYVGRDQFRMLRGFKEMKKTQQAAKRYQRMNMLGVLEAFNSYVSDDHLPYQQNLNYVLIKLQGLAKLLIRLVTCARNSVKFFLGFIRAGSFYLKGSTHVASLAKIWDISRSMCLFSVNFYNNFITFRDKLKFNENIKWDANNCQLPGKLDEWLGSEYEDFIINESFDFKLLTSEEIKNLDRSKNLKIFDDLKEENSNQVEKVSNLLEIKIEPNEIEDFTPLSRKSIKTEDDYIHSIASIKSKDHVKKFITTEDRLRKVNAEHSVTIKKVKKKAWKNFKNDLKTKLSLMQEESLVEYFNDHLNEFIQ